MPPSPSVRIIDHDGTFFAGCKSDSDPNQVPMGSYWMGVNTMNVGGVLSCRPGYRCWAELPDGRLQGSFMFRPEEGLEQVLVVIEGLVYVADWPFTTFRQLQGLQFSPFAKQVYWVQAVQSVERQGTGIAPAIIAISPKVLVLIQDGGFTAPAFYDGSNWGHISGDPYGTPAGSDMAWVGDRLWVAREHQVFASDISNPLSFREFGYLGGQESFFFRSNVTAMVVTPSTESPQLMVFTDTNGTLLQANIRERALWTTTNNFQEEVIGVGCLSSRAAVSHYGRLVWFAPTGVVFYDPALAGKIVSRLPVRDNEMMVSKATLGEDLSLVAMAVFGQFLMVSVPAEDTYNRHTWVLNMASLETLSDASGPSWMGYWIGTRPVEWMFGQTAGSERIYYVSVDFDGKNRLWEAFIPDRMDNRCPITWGVFTRGHFGATAAGSEKSPGTRCRLQWVDIALAAVEEDTNFGVFYAGGTRGSFRQMLNRLVSVQRGSLEYDQTLEANTQIYAFKPQARTIRTEDANQQVADSEQAACGVEAEDQDNIDRSFQLLVVGQGPASIRWIRSVALLVPEDLSGDSKACQAEPAVNAVRFDGVGTHQDTLEKAILDLAAQPLAHFTAAATQSLTQDGFSAVGVGFGESIISQETADRVAEEVATRTAENELQAMLPLITSYGKDDQ